MPANPDIASVPVSGGEYAPRKARITKEDLVKHGYTPGCPGCIAAQGDGSRQFRRHTDECRRRMIELLPGTRQKLTTDRSKQWIAEQVEKSDATMEDAVHHCKVHPLLFQVRELQMNKEKQEDR